MAWTEVAGFTLGATCVWLIVREHVWNWPVGIAQCAFYIVVFWNAGLYADAGLQVVFIVLGFIGWHWWLHGGAQRSVMRIAPMPLRMAPTLLLIGAIGTGSLALLLDRATESTVPFWDALITVLSLVAQYMLTRKWLQNWWVWIITDVISIGLYLYKDLVLTALLYAVFLGMCVAGLVRWRRTVAASSAAPSGAAVPT